VEIIMRVRLALGALLLVLAVPSFVHGQDEPSLAYQPNDAGVRLAAAPAEGEPQDTVQIGSDDPYRVGTNSVVTGAMIGGLIGGTVVAIQTVSDTNSDPVAWLVAVSAPIVGGLIGAGVGLIFR